jgi:hypothetical protein
MLVIPATWEVQAVGLQSKDGPRQKCEALSEK